MSLGALFGPLLAPLCSRTFRFWSFDLLARLGSGFRLFTLSLSSLWFESCSGLFPQLLDFGRQFRIFLAPSGERVEGGTMQGGDMTLVTLPALGTLEGANPIVVTYEAATCTCVRRIKLIEEAFWIKAGVAVDHRMGLAA